VSCKPALQRLDAMAMLKARDLAKDHRSRFRKRIEIDVHVGQRHSRLLRYLEVQSLAMLAEAFEDDLHQWCLSWWSVAAVSGVVGDAAIGPQRGRHETSSRRRVRDGFTHQREMWRRNGFVPIRDRASMSANHREHFGSMRLKPRNRECFVT
jgi:hypothetical protein